MSACRNWLLWHDSTMSNSSKER